MARNEARVQYKVQGLRSFQEPSREKLPLRQVFLGNSSTYHKVFLAKQTHVQREAVYYTRAYCKMLYERDHFVNSAYKQ